MSMRQAQIYRKGILAGTLTEDGGEYTFCYDTQYLSSPQAVAISLRFHCSLRLTPARFCSRFSMDSSLRDGCLTLH